MVSIQLYEGWGRAGYEISSGTPPSDYLVNWSKNLYKGWTVVSNDSFHVINLKIDPKNLVVGLANGWASPDKGAKFLMFWPDDLEMYYLKMAVHEKPRGFTYWNCESEDLVVNGKVVNLAKGINKFLKVR